MIIKNFPEDLAELHHVWHRPDDFPNSKHPKRKHPIGTDLGGLEFLVFHRDFINQVHIYFESHRELRVKPITFLPTWSSIPPDLKLPQSIIFTDENGKSDDIAWDKVGLQGYEDQLTHPHFLSKFRNAGKLGTFIEFESGLHSWLHNASSVVYNEEVVAGFHSPQSTWFYQIHGLVQHWWDIWNVLNGLRFMPLDYRLELYPPQLER